MGRWLFLLTLAVTTLFYALEVDAYDPMIGLNCFTTVTFQKFKIKQCYEQTPRLDCDHHAFLILTRHNKWRSISPDAQWLQVKIKKGKVICPPDIDTESN